MSDPHAEIDLFGVAWRLGATLFFVLLNGFFVGAEFALVKVRGARIDRIAEEGSRAARVSQHLIAHMDRYLSACQLGITMASLILGALGEPAVSRLLIACAGAVGLEVAEGNAWVSVVSIGLAFTIITILHMTLGEQAPKMWALQRAEKTLMQTAVVLRVFTAVFQPFIAVVNGISNGLLRLAGLEADLGHESTHTTEEIRSILSLSARAGHISDRQLELTENVFRMVELEVRHIVVPRVDVVYLSRLRSEADNREVLRTASHSRLPFCEDDLDSMLGFVHARDVLDAMLGGGASDLASLAREATFVPDTMPLSDFLLDLQQKRSHCAGVLDEHGSVMGLAFREDALEEIVGRLGDEFDDDAHELVTVPDGGFELRGRMALPEACARTGLTLDGDDEGEETIGGYVVARLGRLPRLGDAIDVPPFRATVIDLGRRRIRRLRLEPLAAHEEDSEQADGDVPA